MAKNWDREAVKDLKARHQDPNFQEPNLSDTTESNTAVSVSLDGKLSNRQIMTILGIATALITSISAYAMRVPTAEPTVAVVAPAAPIKNEVQIETQLATHEVRLNNVDRILQQHEAHDEKIDGKLDKLIDGQNALAVSIARLKPRNGGGQ